ncbi:MAG: DUF2145 domain-containing protein [Betaproteobacteria bacterium]
MASGIRAAALVGLCVSLCLLCSLCRAGSLRYCDQQAELSASQQDTLFRFAGIIKAELEKSGQRVALIARSGLDLSLLGARYSHAGVSLKASPNGVWSVRQLYYACDEQKPRIFDQGMSGFLLGTDNPDIGFVSVVLLPTNEAASLERIAQDDHRALQLLGSTYSANAYAFSVRYQNCNQWMLEMLATAWGDLADTEGLRLEAQRWLTEKRYKPTSFEIGFRPMMWLAALVPWLHNDDHPDVDIGNKIYRVSMPASIESFIKETVPGAERIEFCHVGGRVVIRRGWQQITEGCIPEVHDTVVVLEQ